MLRRNGPVVKSVESVLRLEGSLWWERFVKEVGRFCRNQKNILLTYPILIAASLDTLCLVARLNGKS